MGRGVIHDGIFRKVIEKVAKRRYQAPGSSNPPVFLTRLFPNMIPTPIRKRRRASHPNFAEPIMTSRLRIFKNCVRISAKRAENHLGHDNFYLTSLRLSSPLPAFLLATRKLSAKTLFSRRLSFYRLIQATTVLGLGDWCHARSVA